MVAELVEMERRRRGHTRSLPLPLLLLPPILPLFIVCICAAPALKAPPAHIRCERPPVAARPARRTRRLEGGGGRGVDEPLQRRARELRQAALYA